MSTYDVVLTRDSDSTKLNVSLIETATGPGLTTQSTPYGGNASRMGRIVIGSGDAGSGQAVGLNPNMYARASGWDSTLPGQMRVNRNTKSAVVIDAAYPLNSPFARGGFFRAPDEVEILVAPDGIYENGVSVDVAPANTRFTGSWAVYGDRIFFGLEMRATRASTTMRVRTAAATYANAGMAGSYLTVVGSRMFVVSNAATAPRVSVSWTDATGTSAPSMSTAYTYPTALYAMASGHLGPAFVVGLADTYRGEVITMDTGGSFTNLTDGFNIRGVEFLVPFNGGLVAVIAGRVGSGLFFASVDSVVPMVLPLATSTNISHYPYTDGAGYLLIASDVNTLVVGSTLITLSPDGALVAHEIFGDVTRVGNTHAAYITNDGSGRCIRYAYRDGSPANDLTTATIPLFDGKREYADGTTGMFPFNSWLSSKFPTDGFELAQLLAVSFVAEILPGAVVYSGETLSVKVNGVEIGPVTHSAGHLLGQDISGTTGGQSIRIEVDETIIDREFQIRFEETDDGAFDNLVAVTEPIVLEYVTVPNQYEEVTLQFKVGTMNITSGGGFQKQSRAVALETLSDMCQNPSVWTAQFWDGATYRVVPISYRLLEAEGNTVPGLDSAIAVLTLKRLRDTGRILT